MLSRCIRDERDANLLNDVASAHDAGLTTEAILNGPATATMNGHAAAGVDLVEGLVAKGLALQSHERVALDAASASGRIGAALRLLSVRRSDRAERVRAILRRMIYPAVLCVAGVLASIIGATVTGANPWLPMVVFLAIAGSGFLLYRVAAARLTRPGAQPWPLISPLLANLGELPYLIAMHGLYQAGIKMIEAHEFATKTSPIEAVRESLEEVGERLVAGATYSEALSMSGALHAETRQVLASAEVAGDLEGALFRAAERRQFDLDRQTQRLSFIGTGVVVCVVYGYVIWIILSFYLGYMAQFDVLRR